MQMVPSALPVANHLLLAAHAGTKVALTGCHAKALTALTPRENFLSSVHDGGAAPNDEPAACPDCSPACVSIATTPSSSATARHNGSAPFECDASCHAKQRDLARVSSTLLRFAPRSSTFSPLLQVRNVRGSARARKTPSPLSEYT
eukprot:scaffold1190_cov393-Prasinococcus_capsulatus_cf.AAC.9